MTRKIAVLTSSRADFSHLVWPLRQIDAHPGLTLQLLVTGAHLSHEFGHSITEIEAAGFDVAHRIESLLSSDSDVGMAKTIGVTMLGLTEILAADRPDILLLIADRYEMLAPAAAALALRIPMAHIEGGEISEGAIDDAVRNALTKMAHLHFTPTENARRRVVAMGEEAWRVHAVGAPSIDTLSNQPLDDRDTIASKLKMSLQPAPALVSIHPVTLLDDTLSELDAILDAIRGLDAPIAFCFPNADAGSRELARRARLFCDTRDDARVFVNLPPHEYWSLLSHSAVLIGNSSSGIMETPTLGVPTVNVGERQRGRDRAANIIDVAAEAA
ncbi:MAG: UDP-N-acetylglucosamine 2-epimerase (hydrolyzing), partial [Gammaproteobacteria bacterium]|nr:UDP-N-acetylglucosamine 2-epimerase (hydrolyzing) [Gammaproteobacteria bacterium]